MANSFLRAEVAAEAITRAAALAHYECVSVGYRPLIGHCRSSGAVPDVGFLGMS